MKMENIFKNYKYTKEDMQEARGFLTHVRSELMNGNTVELEGIGKLVPYNRKLPQAFRGTPESKKILKFMNDKNFLKDCV